jgi:hypothetical protein
MSGPPYIYLFGGIYYVKHIDYVGLEETTKALIAELSDLRALAREIANTEPLDSEGMCVWCCAGLTSGDEHSEACHWLRAQRWKS